MAQPAIYKYWATYGTQTDFYFATQDVTDTDDLYAGTAWAASDASVSKDGGAEAASTNTPARITAFMHKITLTATEMQASRIFVVIRDQTEPEVYEPVAILITTRATLGSLVIDTTQIGGNVSAITLSGVGTGVGLASSGGATGHGAQFTGGATSGSGIAAAAATSGSGITAVGVGTGHGFQGTGGNTAGSGFQGTGGTNGNGINGTAGSGVGTITNIFDTVLTSEPTTVFAATDTYGKSIARLMRRFYNLVTQTASQQKQYKDDGTTVLDTMTVSDNGTTQSKGKSA